MSYSRAADVHSFAHAVALGASQRPARGQPGERPPGPGLATLARGAEPRIPPGRPIHHARPSPRPPRAARPYHRQTAKPARPAGAELSELVRLIAVVAENWCRHT